MASSQYSSVADNLARIRERIAAAAVRSGRSADEVSLVAVTKYADLAAVRALVEAGCADLGESRPQQLWQRASTLGDLAVRWHLIGHLQRNKVARTVEIATLIQSCDSTRLAHSLDQAGRASQPVRRIPVLLEVNVSEDPAKHGFAPADMPAAVEAIGQLPQVAVRGLMAMAGRADDPAAARADFRRLRLLRDSLRAVAPPNVSLDELSIGMSGDFEVAIEEGATIVRIGSALFAGAEE